MSRELEKQAIEDGFRNAVGNLFSVLLDSLTQKDDQGVIRFSIGLEICRQARNLALAAIGQKERDPRP